MGKSTFGHWLTLTWVEKYQIKAFVNRTLHINIQSQLGMFTVYFETLLYYPILPTRPVIAWLFWRPSHVS
jgi:hypothetical protein